MSSLFIPHGSPMAALDKNAGQVYRRWAKTLPRPKAVLIFSAHWETEGLAFGETGDHQRLIYDFYGFPDVLNQLQYPAPGAGFLIEPVLSLLKPMSPVKETKRGLDHGVWVPLLHMWPAADVPVLQMSLPRNFSNQELFALGQKLAPLREQGVIIAGGGTLTHNLSAWNPQAAEPNNRQAEEFDAWVVQTLHKRDFVVLLQWQSLAPHAQWNHPSPEHFRPLLIVAGASTPQDTLEFPVEGFDYGIFSRRAVQFV